MIIYVNIPKELPKNLLKLINEYSKVVGYKVVGYAFLCINNKQLEFEVKKIPFTIAPKKIKYLDINLTNIYRIYMWKTTKLMKEVKDLNEM